MKHIIITILLVSCLIAQNYERIYSNGTYDLKDGKNIFKFIILNNSHIVIEPIIKLGRARISCPFYLIDNNGKKIANALISRSVNFKIKKGAYYLHIMGDSACIQVDIFSPMLSNSIEYRKRKKAKIIIE
jgi:hypothetical protein